VVVRSITQRGALDRSCASVCVCVHKLGIYARANMSKLECRPVSRIGVLFVRLSIGCQ
jgi:hypothetical protein